jgi:hypothetical protein
MSRYSRFPIAAALALPLLAASPRSPADEAGVLNVGGSFAMKVIRQENVAVVDMPGHALILGEARGLNHSTGRDVYMDGAEVWSGETGDLMNGSGSNGGHLVLTFRGDTVHTCWSGQVSTTAGPDGRPVIELEGTWVVVQAMGKYRQASGQGTYRGRFTGPGEYAVEWQGSITLPEIRASR